MINKNKDRLIITTWKPIKDGLDFISSEINISKSEIVTSALYMYLATIIDDLQMKKYDKIIDDIYIIKEGLREVYDK